MYRDRISVPVSVCPECLISVVKAGLEIVPVEGNVSLNVVANESGVYGRSHYQRWVSSRRPPVFTMSTGHIGSDAFVRKYDLDGNEIWTHQFGTEGDEIGGDALTVDSSGVYVGCITDGTFPNQDNPHGYRYRQYLRKYDSDGNELWTHQYDGREADEGPAIYGIAVDATGIYLTGQGQEFIRKCDLAGNEVWVLQLSDANGIGRGIVSSPSGVYLAGTSSGSLPGVPNVGGDDIVLAKISKPLQQSFSRAETLSKAIGFQ